MSVLHTGDKVDLYYYGEGDCIRSVLGKVEDLDLIGIAIVTTITGELRFFPWHAVQQVLLNEAFNPDDAVSLG